MNGIGGNQTVTSGAGEIGYNNRRWFTQYVVDQSATPGSDAEYTTIQAAINAAAAGGGGEVYVRVNTVPYTENLTLIGGVNVNAVSPDGRLGPYGGSTVLLVGNHTFTGSGAVIIKGMLLNNTAGTLLTQSNTTGICLVGFIDCEIESNGDFVHVSSTGTAAICSLLDTNLLANGAVGIIGVGGTFSTIGSQMQGFTGSALQVSGNVALRTSTLTSAAAAVEIVLAGASAGFDYCQFGGTIGVLMTASGGVSADNCSWDCTDPGGFYIAGATGTYTYDNDNIQGSANQIAPGISQQKSAWRPRAQAIAAVSTGPDYGTCAFNNAQFDVNDGFVSLVGGGINPPITSFTVDTSTAPGTNPVLADVGGNIVVTGGQVPAGTTPNVIQTDSLADNTYTIQIQQSAAVGASDPTQNGVAHFNSAQFSVDGNGFVSSLAAVTRNYTSVTNGMSPYTVLPADDFISCDLSGGPITLLFPDSPTVDETWTVKDRLGLSATNNLTITTVSGIRTIDTLTSYVVDTDFEALDLLANPSSNYEVF